MCGCGPSSSSGRVHTPQFCVPDDALVECASQGHDWALVRCTEPLPLPSPSLTSPLSSPHRHAPWFQECGEGDEDEDSRFSFIPPSPCPVLVLAVTVTSSSPRHRTASLPRTCRSDRTMHALHALGGRPSSSSSSPHPRHPLTLVLPSSPPYPSPLAPLRKSSISKINKILQCHARLPRPCQCCQGRCKPRRCLARQDGRPNSPFRVNNHI